MKKHILFDFDGTLLNTNDIIVDSWQAVFLHYTGKPGDITAIYHSFGETIRDTVGRFLPEVDPGEAIQVYRDYQNAHYDGAIHLFPGLHSLVTELRARGCTVSIVTSRTKSTTEAYLDELGIRELFDVVLTCDDTDAHKPDPLPILLALEQLGADREDAIMLGDTKYDIGCANNAGVDSVLVGWSHDVDLAEMESLGFRPTYRIEAPEELLALV